MGASQEREQRPDGSGRRHAPAGPLPQDGGAPAHTSAALSRAAAGALVGVRSPGLVRSLARSLGNRALSRLADGGDLDISRQASGDTVRRTPGGGGALPVTLSFSESAMQRYQVNGATMEEVDGQLPETLGEFRHNSDGTRYTTANSEEGYTYVTGVNIPVVYYYIMPEWTRLAEQTPAIQAAWRRFYNDLMTHEREHLSVSRREYNKLRTTLRALPADERSEFDVQSAIDTAIDAQNEIHESHTGFSTPATLVFSDYIPRPQTPQGTTAEPAAPEDEE